MPCTVATMPTQQAHWGEVRHRIEALLKTAPTLTLVKRLPTLMRMYLKLDTATSAPATDIIININLLHRTPTNRSQLHFHGAEAFTMVNPFLHPCIQTTLDPTEQDQQ